MKCTLYLFHFLLFRIGKNMSIQIRSHGKGAMSQNYLQGFHVSALFYVACCKCIPEGMMSKSLNLRSLLTELIQNIVYRIAHCMGCNRLGSIASQEDVITQLSHENVPVKNRNLIFCICRIFFIVSFIGISRLLVPDFGVVSSIPPPFFRETVLVTWITLFM